MNKIKTPPNPDFRPLYVQVMEIISKRIEKGEWGPGEVLPAEPKFAEELGVSQGTVRKALDNIARKKIVVRRQGRGTFVAEHSPDMSLFRATMNSIPTPSLALHTENHTLEILEIT